MTTIQSTRKEIKKIIDKADDRVVKMVYAMLKTDEEYSVWADDEFIAKLQKRDKEMDKPKNNLGWDQIKENNRKALALRVK